MNLTKSLTLNEDEMLLLDGKCTEENQKEINKIKEILNFGATSEFVGRALLSIKESGEFRWVSSHDMSTCLYCDNCPRGYQKYPRNGRHHRKGDSNHDKPYRYRGFTVNPAFVRFTGIAGCCPTCFGKFREEIFQKMREFDIKAQCKMHGYENEISKDEQRKCHNCKELMWTSEMRREPVMIGNGTFASECPHCKARSSTFGNSHHYTGEFRILEK